MKNSTGLGSSIPTPRVWGVTWRDHPSMETSGLTSRKIENLGPIQRVERKEGLGAKTSMQMYEQLEPTLS